MQRLASILIVLLSLSCAAPEVHEVQDTAPALAPVLTRAGTRTAEAPAPAATRVEPAAEPQAALAPALLQRVAVVGASAANGFGLQAELGVSVRMADVVDAAIAAAHGTPLDSSNSFLFMDPVPSAERVVERALAFRPSLVVAPDFLFWFSYGAMPESSRAGMLERGLALLERFECPVLVGDLAYLPDAVGKMLFASQLPDEDVLAGLNARIRAWAGEHPDAVLVPVARFAEDLTQGKPVRVHGHALGGAGSPALLQPDDLHPTLLGTAGLVVLAFDSLVAARSDLPQELFLWDPVELARRVLAAALARQ